MLSRGSMWKQARSALQVSVGQSCKRRKTTNSTPASQKPPRPDTRPHHPDGKPVDLGSIYESIPQQENEKRSQDRDFLVSMLSSIPTKRDAKQYLKTFGSSPDKQISKPPSQSQDPGIFFRQTVPMDGIRSVSRSPQFIQGQRKETATAVDNIPHVAIVKIQNPQDIDDTTLGGLAKTLAQLRTLGLLGIVVIDCGPVPDTHGDWLDVVARQAMRVAKFVNSYGGPLTPVVDTVFAIDPEITQKAEPFVPGRVFVDLPEPLQKQLKEGAMAVLPPYASSTATSEAQLVDTNELVLALTRYFSGLQFSPAGSSEPSDPAASRTAAVDRIIVIDSLGGIPSRHRPNGAHIFLNMESEFDGAKDDIESLTHSTSTPDLDKIKERHRNNLTLIRHTLSMLPSTSSALLTTPTEAANLLPPDRDASETGVFGYVGSVGTRRSLNPLIHNLLTDRPIYSSSLPLSRVTTKSAPTSPVKHTPAPRLSKTTLAKRGMPVTIYPDPRVTPWVPPTSPDSPRLRLTDTCVDLPRLVNLIDDSFGRKLDVEHYLARVNENIAGIIIAGEYEGGAILTWEAPWAFPSVFAPSSTSPEPQDPRRLVPYLDKFAVLKRAQGAGGVADVVFNAMVDDCFPRGVCWRSRKDNPVNKWYFERSRGTWKLDGTNWAMFWTMGSEVFGGEEGRRRLWDYERVCRGVEPSWADKKAVVD